MSSQTELDGLLKEKAQLERILQTMGEEERYLRQRLTIIAEKLSIQELKEKIKEKRVVIEQLKSKIRELERRLKEPQKKEPMEVMVRAVPTDEQKEKKKDSLP